VKLKTFVNSALFCFTKVLILRNTIQDWCTRHSTCSIWSPGLKSTLYSVKLSVRACYGVEHSKRLKCPVTGGYLIKTPPSRQSVQYISSTAVWHFQDDTQ
jgi:hypothetical protein